jgi:hypothetical protein
MRCRSRLLEKKCQTLLALEENADCRRETEKHDSAWARRDGRDCETLESRNGGYREYRISLTIEPNKAEARGLSSHPAVVDHSIITKKITKIPHFCFWRNVSNKNLILTSQSKQGFMS